MKKILTVLLLSALLCTLLVFSAMADECEHKWVEEGRTDAECEVEGSIDYRCEKCQATKSEPIKALSHNYGKAATTSATCTEKGKKVYTCSICQGTKEEYIDALGHNYTKNKSLTTEATCVSAGTVVYKCSRCTEPKIEDVDALGHDFSKLVSTSATCTTAGKSTYQCVRCNEYEIRDDKALGHDYEKTGGPTCTKSGKYINTCTRCDYTKTDTTTTKALGHDIPETGTYAWKTTKHATCDSEGSRRARCSRCKEYVYEDIPKTDHDYSSDYYMIKAPTSATSGKYEVVCEDCGDVVTKTISKGTTNLGKYTVPPVTASLASGMVDKGTLIELECDLASATIYYTVNGKSPTSKSARIEYDGAIEIDETTTIKAYAVYEPNDDVDYSDIITRTYLVEEEEDETDGIVTPTGDVVVEMMIDSKVAYINDGEKLLDAVPVIRNSRTMLPIRFVAEALGAAVGWDDETRTVSVITDEVIIKIVVGATVAKVDGEEVELDSPAYIDESNNRTYLPVRFVAEALGAIVGWDDATRVVTLAKSFE